MAANNNNNTPKHGERELNKLDRMWGDQTKKRLWIHVVEGQSLAPKDMNGLSDPYIKIIYGKDAHKGQVYPKTLAPKFENEVFYLELNGQSELTIEIWDHDTVGSDDFMGLVQIGIPENSIKPEVITDDWHHLKARPGREKKEFVSGKIRVSFYLATLPLFSSQNPEPQSFNYKSFAHQFKTGDLILYDGVGLIPTITKIKSHSYYSSCGMIVKMPNKYTGDPELYLLELTRNLEGFLDVIKEVPGFRVCLFRLFERLHQVHAHTVWYCPLQDPLSPQQELDVIDLVRKVHSTEVDQMDNRVSSIFQEIDVALEADRKLRNAMITQYLGKDATNSKSFGELWKRRDFDEMYSSILIGGILKAIGKQLSKYDTPTDLFAANESVYPVPVIIRCMARNGKIDNFAPTK